MKKKFYIAQLCALAIYREQLLLIENESFVYFSFTWDCRLKGVPRSLISVITARCHNGILVIHVHDAINESSQFIYYL